MAITPCVSVLRDPRQLGGPWPASRREFWVPDQVPARLPIEHNVCIKGIERVTTESNAPSNRVECTSKKQTSKPTPLLFLSPSTLYREHTIHNDDEEQLRNFRENPIGNSLDGFHDDVKNNVRKGLTFGRNAWLPPNRVHRRLILSKYGISIEYGASSKLACTAWPTLRKKAGILHRDISLGNLKVSKEDDRGFLIDLDHAVKEVHLQGSERMVGILTFMANGALEGKRHWFMHDLESFFWVLFWIRIHHGGMGEDLSHDLRDLYKWWHYESASWVANVKLGLVALEERFTRKVNEQIGPRHASLAPALNELQQVVFFEDEEQRLLRGREDENLYALMKEILRRDRGDVIIEDAAKDGEKVLVR
ncbi:hypothetical protein QC762_110625 [Podospora pseudocomata]|uniref:Fungal-type protein kinase domain-containing protein n=1 Tax=Podospora pseudocomata TaxID=2093779 RepID=A0ABR0GUP7_9PEZI|nr:hypothetical protein QC762_110625 [Podospora pseudocomata]